MQLLLNKLLFLFYQTVLSTVLSWCETVVMASQANVAHVFVESVAAECGLLSLMCILSS